LWIFLDKFGRILEKILFIPKHLPAPTPAAYIVTKLNPFQKAVRRVEHLPSPTENLFVQEFTQICIALVIVIKLTYNESLSLILPNQSVF